MEAVLPSLLRAATAILRDPVEAEDVALTVLARVLPLLATFEPPEGFVRYLRRSTRNAAVDAVRLRVRTPRPLGDGQTDARLDPEDIATDPELRAVRVDAADRIWLAVTQLDEPARSLVHLHYRDGLPIDQAAERLGISKSTAKRHLRAARLKLAVKLRELEEPSG